MMQLNFLVAFIAVIACASARAMAQANLGAKFPGKFDPRLGEPAQRNAISYTGLVFDYNENPKGATPNGIIQADQVSQNPFLSTLPGDGNGQTLIKLGPCAGNTVHHHPRGSEISYIIEGELDFGLIEENSSMPPNKPIVRHMKAGQTIHIPQGLLHFSHNPTCKPVSFIANFATADPGSITTWRSFAGVPPDVLHLSTGILETTWAKLTKTPSVVAPGTGGTECLKKCGLTFAKENSFEPATYA